MDKALFQNIEHLVVLLNPSWGALLFFKNLVNTSISSIIASSLRLQRPLLPIAFTIALPSQYYDIFNIDRINFPPVTEGIAKFESFLGKARL
jgi:hypothetical protein